MSKRTKAHIIGDIASGHVQLALVEAGWAVDKIASDYGEDVFAKPTKPSGEVDTFHVLVQVKAKGGSAPDANEAAWSKSFKIGHVERWLRMREPVVVALWSIDANKGRFCSPSWQLDLMKVLKLTSQGKKRLSLKFSREDCFQKNRLDKLAWFLRLEHEAERDQAHRNACGNAQQELDELRSAENIRTLSRTKVDPVELAEAETAERWALTAWQSQLEEVLELLKFTVSGSPTDEIVAAWSEESNRLWKSDTSYDLQEDELHFWRTTICERVQELSGHGMLPLFEDGLARRLQQMVDELQSMPPVQGAGGTP